MTPHLTRAGSRLTLRDIQLHDLDAYAHWMHPSQQWHQLDGPYYPKMSADDIPQMIDKIRQKIENAAHPTPRNRLAIAHALDDHIMGMVSCYWISQETNWLAIGIAIWNPEDWSQGYGYEALGMWCDYLFEQMPDIVRLDLRTWSGNQGMMTLAQKLGFTCEARFRQARIVKGNYYDGLGYGILRDEWQQRYSPNFVATLS